MNTVHGEGSYPDNHPYRQKLLGGMNTADNPAIMRYVKENYEDR